MSQDAVERVADAIQSLGKPALCLDFDGTLVEIAPRPEAISVAEELPGLLAELHSKLDRRLAIITGRAHADLSTYLDVTAFPVASSHGAEFSPAGSSKVQSLIDGADLDPLRPPLADAIKALDGVYLEDKGTAIAVHTRPNPETHDGLIETLSRVADDHEGVHVAGGKGIVEVRLATENKGTAVARLAELDEWAGAKPVMIGDDTTDNDGMEVAKRLGGLGVQVGDGPDGTKLSHATLTLGSVQQAHSLLRRLID
ncbi:MAG: trehalose-phosphatase [Rhizobiales bacterium]|nr:trehalose-phosphatase [Hyphomicrobiales bacterium]MBO6698639.1 trehalose-phosphatase [Hyphomicrobiales bacterium]MBO6735108.1 trehalose-phosphatase [Hyphomicrobiales bacterium]MBO6911085.1 trehalose-phosphatase [Hyphomicrobiales bacterium]MBO6957006.1 trehalose-phosphatase [Hyphomicrobiales bacterium]